MWKWLGQYWGRKIIRHQHQQLRQQQKLLLSLGNALATLPLSDPEIKHSSLYRRCAEVITLLSPMDIKGARYVRVGKDHDGGYVMVDDFHKIEAAYSFGIDNDVSWDANLAQRGIEVYMYDHTIKRLPQEHPKFHYFPLGVTGSQRAPNLKTLAQLMEDNRHLACQRLILKMDIEGHEWDVLETVPLALLERFCQIVIELHDLRPELRPAQLAVLRKMNETHQSVHVHANCLSVPQWVGGLVLPETLEVTYVRKQDYKDRLTANTRQFPTDLDQPCAPDFPDVYLGRFSV